MMKQAMVGALLLLPALPLSIARAGTLRQEILQTIPATDAGNLHYQLAIAPCDTSPCPVGIRLARGTQQLGWYELVKGRAPEPKPYTDDDYAWDDPLRATEESYWFIKFNTESEPPYAAAIFLRPFRLEPHVTGLLATATLHTHHGAIRRHALLLAEGDSLRKVWGAADPYFLNTFRWSAAKPFSVADGATQGIMHLALEDRRYAADLYGQEMYDQWDVNAYRWNVESRELEEVAEADRPALYAVIVGSYATVEEAREKFAEFNKGGPPRRSCLLRFWVVRSNWFPRLRPDWSIIAVLSASQEAVLEELAKAKECNPAVEGYLRRVQ